MLGRASGASWWNAISKRVRESDIERQVLFNRVRRAGIRLYFSRLAPAGSGSLLAEYLKILLGSLIGFWLITTGLEYFFGVTPLYALPVFGFLYSVQSAYHRYRLSVDPEYKIPRCRCPHQSNDDSEKVLQSSASATLRIPNSVVGALFYPAFFLVAYPGHVTQAWFLAILAVAASAYFGYVMIARIAGLCSACINIAAVNVLVLWQFLR
jgi:uncharacterized membrane protein